MPTTAIFARRLLKLADFIEKLPRKQFDITDWGHKTECGTVACVAGWAGLIPAFRRAGLKTELNPHGCDISFNGRLMTSSLAFTNFFGDAAFSLCMPGYPYPDNPTPKQAAKAIRRWVKENYHHDN